MAKKEPPIKLDIHFFMDDGQIVTCGNVIHKTLPLSKDGKHFAHLEKKGNQWLFLHTEGMLFDNIDAVRWIDVKRDNNARIPNFVLCDERPLFITRYTVLTPINIAPFYHIDELPDSTYRITHSTNFFNSDAKASVSSARTPKHDQLIQIRFIKVTK